MAIEHKPLIEYLPPFLAEYREYRRLFDVLWDEISEKDGSILERTDLALKNTFIEEADLEGIKHWEAMLDIVPPAGSTLEERRRIVAATWIGVMPINRDGVIEIVKAYSGHGGNAFWEDTGVLRVEFDNTEMNPVSIGLMKSILRQRLPANIFINLQVVAAVQIAVTPTVKAWPTVFTLAGTQPKTNIGLGLSGDGLVSAVETQGRHAVYKICGDEALDG